MNAHIQSRPKFDLDLIQLFVDRRGSSWPWHGWVHLVRSWPEGPRERETEIDCATHRFVPLVSKVVESPDGAWGTDMTTHEDMGG